MNPAKFLQTLRGVWLLTWKSQLTWRRLPMWLLGLLALPVLVYITTSQATWSQRHSLLGSPNQRFGDLSRRLARGGMPLRAEQSARLLQVFNEEFARTESETADDKFSESGAGHRQAMVTACYERIHDRARDLLDARQFTRYESFESRILLETERRASEPVWTRPGAFYHWIIDFYFFVMLPLNCVRTCGALIRDELQSDTLGFLTTRPQSRASLLMAKYLSQTAWLQILMGLETLLLFGVGILRSIPDVLSLLPLLLLVQFLAVLAWSALGTFFGLATNRYMALAVLYGLIVELGIGRIPTNINTLSLMRHLKVLLAHNRVLEEIYEWSGKGVPVSVGALVLATVLFLAIAGVLFTFREYHHTAEMQK